MMGLESLVLCARYATLLACFAAVAAWCCAAALRRGEGAAGAAVRILVTVLAPATALAFCGLLWWPLALGASTVAAAWQGYKDFPALVVRLRTDWAALSPVAKTAFLTLGAAVALRAGGAVSTPPGDGDSLLYHLPMVAALVQDHSMWFTRALVYPATSELGEAVAAAATGTVNGIVAFQCLQIGVLLLVGFGWARRLGASLDGSAAAGVLAGGLPLAIDQMFTSQNDMFVCTVLAAGCLLWRPSPRLSALAFGLALAAKVTAFVFVPAIVIVLALVEGWTLSASDVLWAASMAAPWYLRTWVLTGGPIYTVASMGWRSTLAANLKEAAPFMVSGLRTYGGIGALAGIAASIFLALRLGRSAFQIAQLWLAVAALVSWMLLPNAAESVLGTLDEIRNGWSLRYALLLPFIAVVALPVALDLVRRFPLAALAAVVAAASALVRSANLTQSAQPSAIAYAVPLLVALIAAWAGLVFTPRGRGRSIVATAVVVLALATSSLTMVVGERSIRALWQASYLQWTTELPPSSMLFDPDVRGADKVAVIGLRSFPFVGPQFATRTYDNVLVETPATWLAALRRGGVRVLVASGPTGSPDQPGFLRPLPTEKSIAASPGVCLLAALGYARVYGLEPSRCGPRGARVHHGLH